MSHKKIEKLTPEQEALIPVYREKWRKIALSTEPINREKAAKAVKLAYAFIHKQEPEIIFCESPYAALNTNISLEALIQQEDIYNELVKVIKNIEWYIFPREPIHYDQYMIVKKIFKNKLDYQMRQLKYQLLQQVDELEELTKQIKNCLKCKYYIGNACMYDFLISLNYSYKIEYWEFLMYLLKECDYIFPFKDVCIVCDRPRILSFDNQHRLHEEGAPAIQFADGYSLYAYHGVTLPEKYGKIHPNQWQASWLLEEQNAELRRVLIQGIGYERIASELGATELDSFQEYSLLKIDTDVDIEPIYMLNMTCPSTGYIHVLRVPPPPNVKSAREAIRWVNWGIDPEDFAVQT